MTFGRVIAVFVLMTVSCFAADVDGKWAGSVSTPNGDFPVTFAFKADGTTLTGTTGGPQGDTNITNGKVDGNNISFTVTLDFGGMPLTINYKGAVAKDQIKMTLEVMGMPIDLVVKKAA